MAASVTLKQLQTTRPRDCTATGGLAPGNSSSRP
jgi:hypothetical protein